MATPSAATPSAATSTSAATVIPDAADVESAPLDWYASPLYYDIVFDEETAAECAWLDALFHLFGPPPDPSEPDCSAPRLLEPACGSGRLLHALLLRGYSCTGFDRQAAAVTFARQRCEATLATKPALKAPAVASNAEPACCVFEADLLSFSTTHPLLVPPASFHLAHCLVSSLKYLPSDAAMLQHFAAVHACLVPGGLYVVALHVADYDDRSSSVDEHTAERAGVRVAMRITCQPPDALSRTEQVHVRLAVSSTATESSAAQYHWAEVLRTYDRLELWRLLAALSQRGFDVAATFDYEQARRGRVEETLDWPQPLQRFDASASATLADKLTTAEAAQLDWTGWQGVEAVAVVLRRKSAAG